MRIHGSAADRDSCCGLRIAGAVGWMLATARGGRPDERALREAETAARPDARAEALAEQLRQAEERAQARRPARGGEPSAPCEARARGGAGAQPRRAADARGRRSSATRFRRWRPRRCAPARRISSPWPPSGSARCAAQTAMEVEARQAAQQKAHRGDGRAGARVAGEGRRADPRDGARARHGVRRAARSRCRRWRRRRRSCATRPAAW